MKEFKLIFLHLFVLASFLWVSTGYGEGNIMPYNELREVPDSVWQNLSKKKVFFGHQSVGYNIIDGLRSVMKDNPKIDLRIVEGYAETLFLHPVFAHSRVGENTRPISKIEDFKNILFSGIGNEIDIAILKFCYVDITDKTDIKHLLHQYLKMVSELQSTFPKLMLIHCTVPLKVSEISWKTKLKSMLGRDAWEVADNIKRNQYNRLIRKQYGSIGTVFDIARAESTLESGQRVTFMFNGKTYEMLYPGYSSDGGHLNQRGKKAVAEQLLLTISALLD